MSHKFSRAAAAGVNFVVRWMDGSLVLRSLMRFMEFLGRVAMGSFFAALFVAPQRKPGGVFVRFLQKCADIIPTPLHLPTHLPARLRAWLNGSWVLRTLISGVDANIPGSTDKTVGWLHTLRWLGYVLPMWLFGGIVILTPILPTMTLGVALLCGTILLLSGRKPVINRLSATIIFFMGINIFAGVFSLGGIPSLQIAVLTCVFMLAAIIIPACTNGKNTADFYLLCFLGGAGLTAIVGFWQVFAGYVTPLWIDRDVFTDFGLRVFSTLGNPNVYGTYLLLVIPPAAAAAVYFRHRLLRVLCALLAMGLAVNLLLTYSRGCYLALAVAVFVFLLIIQKRLVVLFVPIVAALPLVLPAAIVNRFFSILNFGDMDTSTIHRLSIWRGSLRALGDFWPIGIGPGTDAFIHVYPYYSLAGATSAHSHNLFLQIALELGIIGLVAFILVLAAFISMLANFLRKTTELRLRVMAAAFIAAPVGLLVQGMFDHALYSFPVLLALYILLGLGAAFVKAHSDTCDAPQTAAQQ